MDPLNKSADLSALRIERETGPRGRRFLYSALATICVALVAVLFFAKSRGGVALRPPEVTTTRASLVTPTQASTVFLGTSRPSRSNSGSLPPGSESPRLR